MNLKLFKVYGLICFFPLWIFRSNFTLIEIIVFFVLMVILPFYVHKQIFKYYLKKQSKKIYFWLSLITFYSIDQNLSLWINSNFIITRHYNKFVPLILFITDKRNYNYGAGK